MKAQFSLFYEIIGLIIFGIVSLIWFTGIESMIGSVFQDKAMTTFNTLVGGIKSSCNGENATLFNLDLNVYGHTYIITQLKIPKEFIQDPETMGMLQPQMRKCVGSTCLCLMDLKELEGNWQMCITTDFDSWNYILGSYAGPPGCPFWYYAPPSMVSQALQGMLDIIQEGGTGLISSIFLPSVDLTEKYSFPAPEVWGGCAKADESNILVSSYKNVVGKFNCQKVNLDTKKFSDYFDDYSILLGQFSSIDFDTSVINNDAVNGISSHFLEIASQKIGNVIRDDLEDDYKTLVKYNLGISDIEDECVKNSIINNIHKAYDNQIIEGDGQQFTKELYFPKDAIDRIGVDITSNVKTKFTLGTCTYDVPEGESHFVLPASCISSQEINFNSDNLVNYKIIIYRKNEIVIKAIADKLNAVLDSANFDSYKEYIINALKNEDFLSLVSSLNLLIKNYYQLLFNDMSDKVLFNSDCEQVYFPDKDLRNSVNEILNNVNESIYKSVKGMLVFDSIPISDAEATYDLNNAIDEFSLSLASSLSPYIEADCGEFDVDEYANFFSENLKSSNLGSQFSNVVLPTFYFQITYDDIIKFINDDLKNLLGVARHSVILGVDNSINIINSAINDLVMNAYDNVQVKEVNCWPKGNGTYFKAYSAVNDLLGYREYYSVARLEPQLYYIALKTALTSVLKFVTASVFIKPASDVETPEVSKSSNIKAMTKEGFDSLLKSKEAEVSLLTGEHVLPTGRYTLSSITGYSIASKLAKLVTKEIIKVVYEKLKDILKENWKGILGYYAVSLVGGIGINFYMYTLITRVNYQEVKYTNGAIRTFDPNKILVRKCVRIDELCGKDEAVWVKENKSCKTDIFVRRLGDPSQWYRIMKGEDVCKFKQPCTEESCIRDTLTACYKYSCFPLSEDDAYHVFQYWVGAPGDPAGLFDKSFGIIRQLKIYRAEENPDKEWSSKIIMEVVDGNVE